MHDGKLKPGQLDKQMVTETYNELNNAAGAGYGKGWTKFGANVESDKAVLLMQQNIFRFSGAKTYTQLMELNQLLTKDGKMQSWPDFKAAALQVNEKYNVNHLQAEHQTAQKAANSARQWQDIQQDKHLFPNLKYKTVGDSRVRPEHEKLDGIVAPVDSPFWDKYMPPNGWRCRCRAVQTAERASNEIPEKVENVPDAFKFNPGKHNQVFLEKDTRAAKAMPQFQIAKDAGKSLQKAMEAGKLYAPYTDGLTVKNGSKVAVSPFADLQDLEANFKTAATIADQLGVDVKIRPHLDRTIVKGKNPEYEIHGKLADRKGVQGLKGIAYGIDAAKTQMLDKDTNPEQEPYVIVFDLSSIDNLDLTELKTTLNKKINGERGKNIHSVIFVNGKKAVELLREEIVSREYSKLSKIQ